MTSLFFLDTRSELVKLGTVKDGSRDGKLAVVSEDLSQAVTVDSIAHTMQEALDKLASV